MAEQPQPLPLAAGTAIPGARDHAWLIEGLDQQYGLGQETVSTWTARVRCVRCGVRAALRAAEVPPCRPRATPPGAEP